MTSIKIRSHLDVKRRKGEFIGSFTVYGYKKDERNHNLIIVDEYAAGIVSNIFSWKIAGMSQQGIADRLNDMGVLSPAEYKKSCGSNYRAKFQTKSKASWSAVAVTRILTNENYTRAAGTGRLLDWPGEAAGASATGYSSHGAPTGMARERRRDRHGRDDWKMRR